MCFYYQYLAGFESDAVNNLEQKQDDLRLWKLNSQMDTKYPMSTRVDLERISLIGGMSYKLRPK